MPALSSLFPAAGRSVRRGLLLVLLVWFPTTIVFVDEVNCKNKLLIENRS
jgi:hypothetical protein